MSEPGKKELGERPKPLSRERETVNEPGPGFTDRTVEKEAVECAKKRYLENLYNRFLKTEVEEYRDSFFHFHEVYDSIRPPYSAEDVRSALENEPDVEPASEKLDIWYVSQG